jgi:hypothetical protein
MQGHYGAPIDQKLKEVQVRAEAFVKQVEVCLHRKVDEIHYLARVNYNQTSTLLDSAQTTETALEDIKENLGSLAEGQKEAQNSLYSMLEGLMKNSECEFSLSKHLSLAAVFSPSNLSQFPATCDTKEDLS